MLQTLIAWATAHSWQILFAAYASGYPAGAAAKKLPPTSKLAVALGAWAALTADIPKMVERLRRLSSPTGAADALSEAAKAKEPEAKP